MTEPLELSCYTANLVPYLERGAPTVRDDLAAVIGLSVRTAPPGGTLAFAHHPRVDACGLAYRSADDWPTARAALQAELARLGRVLVVGNTRHMPWSPSRQQAATPHWFVLHGHKSGRWLAKDRFAALTPHGEQIPYAGTLTDAELRDVLTPLGEAPPEIRNRDRYALGEAVELPAYSAYRWLEPADATAPARPPGDTWVHGLLPALEHLATALSGDDEALARHADDLWTAARHQRFRLARRTAAGLLDPEAASRTAAAWEELPRAIRFAAASAARGRPRHALIEKTFAQVVDAVRTLEQRRPAHVA
ncbi:hypothetical protein [Streptomyces sp. ISL-11]|uniref:hypothetical protein n=1 Tax=Streptomyces sp. ISL-11 TaxID=2819174 RepID=UPI001BE56444|nr:hypothetical protein [Streptomyces sp. ISL-11]MBT2383354.1 hypothetical protein [Streptomyces sp. ISL-11]